MIFQTDATKKYVDWAVKHHFAVMDINIPRHVTDLEVRYSSCSVYVVLEYDVYWLTI